MSTYNEKNKNVYCPVPWREQMIDSNGELRLCCIAQDIVKNDDGSDVNVAVDSLEEVWNNKYMQDVRKAMMDGVKIDVCNNCYKHEEESGYSNRINELEDYQNINAGVRLEYFDHYKADFPSDIITTLRPDIYDVRFGNLCNLKCISCSPNYSSEWYEEVKKAQTEDFEKLGDWGNYDHGTAWDKEEVTRVIANNKKFEWVNNNKIFENILEQIIKSDTKRIYVTGGEPTITQGNYKLLQALIDNDIAKNIEVWCNTNCTNANPKFYNLLAQFKEVNLMLSIDGIGDAFDYIRYTGKWIQIEKNINKIINFVNENKLKHWNISLVPVIQFLNLLDLENLIEHYYKMLLVSDYGPKQIRFAPITLGGPRYYRVENAELSVRLKISEQLQSKYCSKKIITDHVWPEIKAGEIDVYDTVSQPVLEWIRILNLTLKQEAEGEEKNNIPEYRKQILANHEYYKKYRKIDHLDDWFYATMKRLT